MRKGIYILILCLLLPACRPETTLTTTDNEVEVVPEMRSATEQNAVYTGKYNLMDTYRSGDSGSVYKVYQYHHNVSGAKPLVYPLMYRNLVHRYYFYTHSDQGKQQYSHSVTSALKDDLFSRSKISMPIVPEDSLHAALRAQTPWYEQGLSSVHYAPESNFSYCFRQMSMEAGDHINMSVQLTPVVSRLSLRVIFDNLELQHRTVAICARVYNVYTEINYLTGKPDPSYCQKGSYLVGIPDNRSTALYTLTNQDSVYTGTVYTFPSDTVTASLAATDERSYNRPMVALILETDRGKYYSLSHAHLNKALLAGRQTNAIIRVKNIEEVDRIVVTTNSLLDVPWQEQNDDIDAAEACSLSYEMDTCLRSGGTLSVPVEVLLADHAAGLKVRVEASSEEAWISGVSYTYLENDYGSGMLNFTCAPNTTSATREGKIDICYWYNSLETIRMKIPVVQY